MTSGRTVVRRRTRLTRSAQEAARGPPTGLPPRPLRPRQGTIESGATCSSLKTTSCGGSRSCSGAGWRSGPSWMAATGRRRGRPTSSDRHLSLTTMGGRRDLGSRLEACIHLHQCTNRKSPTIAVAGRIPAWYHPLRCGSCPATAAARGCPTLTTSGRWRRSWRGTRGLGATAVSRTHPQAAAARAGGATTMGAPRDTMAASSRPRHPAPVRRRPTGRVATGAPTRPGESRSRRPSSTRRVAGWTAFAASGRRPNAKVVARRQRSTGAEVGWPA